MGHTHAKQKGSVSYLQFLPSKIGMKCVAQIHINQQSDHLRELTEFRYTDISTAESIEHVESPPEKSFTKDF